MKLVWRRSGSVPHVSEIYHTILDTLPDQRRLGLLAESVYSRVFRRSLDQPGFALVTLVADADSVKLRRLMIALKQALSGRYLQASGRRLAYVSLMRFDQQVTTKYHLDGGPDESYLMLGYEPTLVGSELSIADYTQAADDLDITPEDFLAEYNPILPQGERQLERYRTAVASFDPTMHHILIINNSRLPRNTDGGWNSLGVMHRARIPNPMPDARRVVNSLMLAPIDEGDPEQIPSHEEQQEQEFLTMSAINSQAA
jgi:hypothetical protein